MLHYAVYCPPFAAWWLMVCTTALGCRVSLKDKKKKKWSVCWCNFTNLTLTPSKKGKKSAVFLILLDNYSGDLCCSYLGPPWSTRQRHSSYHCSFCATLGFIFSHLCPWQLFFFFLLFSLFLAPALAYHRSCPVTQLWLLPDGQTDRQTERHVAEAIWDFDLFESYSSCWHRLRENLWAWSWQRWRSEEGRDDWYGLAEHFVCVFVCVPKTEGALKTCRYPVCETGLNSGDVPDAISSNFFMSRFFVWNKLELHQLSMNSHVLVLVRDVYPVEGPVWPLFLRMLKDELPLCTCSRRRSSFLVLCLRFANLGFHPAGLAVSWIPLGKRSQG